MLDDPSTGISRRDVLKLGALAGATASLAPLAPSPLSAMAAATAPSDFNEMTVNQLKGLMASGRARSTDLVNFYLRRIQALDQGGPLVNSVIEVNPDAHAIAQQLDDERRAGHVRGPLHGVPVLLKTTSIRTTACNRQPGRWRWSAPRRHRMRRWPPGCGRRAPSSWARPP